MSPQRYDGDLTNDILQHQLVEAGKRLQFLEREIVIEAALERVRARAMTMRSSAELLEIAELLCLELKTLGVAISSSGFTIMNPDRVEGNWYSYTGIKNFDLFKRPVTIDLGKDKYLARSYESWKKGERFLLNDLTGQELKDHRQNLLRSLPPSESELLSDFLRNLPTKPDNILERQLVYHFNFADGNIFFSSSQPLEDVPTLQRFARVFEQTYTRFLDLRKAEAQAMEATVEAALERVRTRAMGMNRSEEIPEVLNVVFEQLQNLGFSSYHTVFGIINLDENHFEFWSKGKGEYRFPSRFIAPVTDHAHFQIWLDDHRRRVEFHAMKSSGKTLRSWDDYIFSLPEMENMPEEAKANFRDIEEAYFSMAYLTHGILFANGPKPLSDDQIGILKRFSKVLDLSYTRMLDLKKAEARAREAQIEAALERIRSRTMAMHRSDELTKTASQIYIELENLGIRPWAYGFNIWQPEEDTLTDAWSCSGSPDIMWKMLVPHTVDPTLTRIYEHKRKGQPVYSEVLNDVALEKHIQYMTSLPGLEEVTSDILDAEIQFPERLYLYAAYFSQGYLLLSTREANAEISNILGRFAKVFEQTYTRFLDLQKAEAQSREALVEAALERVRARTMSMYKSDELLDTAQMFFHQLKVLGITIEVCGFSILEKETPRGNQFLSIKGTLFPEPIPVQFDRDYELKKVYEAWEEKQSTLVLDIAGEALKQHMANMKQLVEELTSVDILARTAEELGRGDGENGRLLVYHAFFNHGYLFLTNTIPIEDIGILVRFASVFEQTYTRFLDLERAEAQAREAQIEAALERVRSRTMGMQRCDELAVASEVLFIQVKSLGIDIISSSITIFNFEMDSMTISSTHDDIIIPPVTVTDRNHPMFKREIQAWKSNIPVVKVAVPWQELQAMSKKTFGVTSKHNYGNSLVYIQNLRHQFGFFGIISLEAIGEAEIAIFQRFAKVFEQTYTRFLDLQKAEKQARRILEERNRLEQTLAELKATQSQLIQSEKMASLGELTAGIAHEIQNPLNFVNNFSEVNQELIDELYGEIERGNAKEILAIIQDLRENEGKIVPHGKRAEAIVKSMLQHSRTSSGLKEMTNINSLCDEYLRLSFHGFRAKDQSFNVELKLDLYPSLPEVEVVPQDIGRVMLNLINNAFQACAERSRSSVAEVENPEVRVSTKKLENAIEITVEDNGTGIPDQIKDKIFQPFFTTKPTGLGTGLGLSLAYDIVKAHGGEIKVHTLENKGSEFTIWLPA